MDFASAFISMQMGHKIKRKHWSGYWSNIGKEVVMTTYEGKNISVKDTADMMYTLSNCACNDWEIADDLVVREELNNEA